jgi:predicted ATPase/class 3 adenylate cyclase
VQALSAVTTFLFTDIEGSTRLWEQEPERMRSALARHDAIARAAVEAHRGLVVKTTGDGVHAAFDDPLDAVGATLELQQVLADPNATHGIALSVRCGLHLGVVERRDNEFFGTPVNRAARLMAAAHGGQMLLSQAVAGLIADRLRDGVTLRDLGVVRLRDLASPEHVFQIVHPQLRQEFPSLRSLEAIPNNLPQQATSFIGRERELAEVKRLLAETRLLTLHGAGGIGKTRLALQAAADVIDDYPDGVWFVDLAPIADPVLVPSAVARTLSVRQVGSEAVTQTLCSHLKPLRPLLILDNCEHLVDACAGVAELLLRAAPNLRILTTSRETLHIAGEQSYRLPSLSLPGAEGDLEALSRSDAVRLFVERSRLQQQDFPLTAQRASAIAELCLRLDGMPLALELAAARIEVLPVEKIVERLNDRFRLLTGGSRTALPRQQTLRALIAWSFDLLSEAEKALFVRLSVFAGGLTLEAAEAVGAGDGILQEDVLDLLSSLVNKSLVLVDDKGERFRLLETIRQFAQERLRAGGEEYPIRARHCGYYLTLVERAGPALLGGPQQKQSLDLLEADHDNLRSALTWALEKPERAESAVRVCGTLFRFWFYRGYWQEGYAWCMKALEHAPSDGDKAARARVLLAAGTTGHDLQEADTRPLLEEALRLSREAGDRHTEAATLNSLARILDWGGELSRVQSLLEQARTINREIGNRSLELINMSNLVNVLRWRDNSTAALALGEEGLAGSRALGSRWLEGAFLYVLADVAHDRGDHAVAQNLAEQALSIFREMGMLEWQAIALSELAALAVVRGGLASAGHYLTEAFDIVRKLGDKNNLAFCLELTGELASKAQRCTEAARFSGAAETLRGSPLPSGPFHRGRIDSYRAQCREALGDAAYAAADAAGRAVSREGAIDEALAWLASAH